MAMFARINKDISVEPWRFMRILNRLEKVVMLLQARCDLLQKPMTEKQRRRWFAYGTTLVRQGRMIYLDGEQRKQYDRLCLIAVTHALQCDRDDISFDDLVDVIMDRPLTDDNGDRREINRPDPNVAKIKQELWPFRVGI